MISNSLLDHNKDFEGTVVNRVWPFLHERSLEITLTVPLSLQIIIISGYGTIIEECNAREVRMSIR